MEFNAGDIVIGISDQYGYTGIGSICRVVRESLSYSGMMDVEVIEPKPSRCPVGSKQSVRQRDFILQDGATRKESNIKIEAIKVFMCNAQLRYEGECGELAAHRLTIPGLSVTLCEAHAKPYLNGEKRLEPVKCAWDQRVCRPGYTRNGDYGRSFCNDECERAYLTRDEATAYAPSPRER